jgi:hypothetical protein
MNDNGPTDGTPVTVSLSKQQTPEGALREKGYPSGFSLQANFV